MAYNREKVATRRCPECFAQEIDMSLRRDAKTGEYYCVRCCFTGTPDEIEAFFTEYRARKYRKMV